MTAKNDNRIYIGNLPQDVRTKDIEDLFYKYGKIKYIDLKNRKGPPFAFVEFEDPLDADEAIEGRDGYNFEGHRLRVELQKGPRTGNGIGAGLTSGRGRSGPPTRRSDYRCIITGLPPTGSWQDLKDHMREAGNVCYADVFKDGTGVVEFIRYDDMKYAVRNLDDTKFRSHEGETSYVRVKMDYTKGHGASSSRSRSRSSSYSRKRRHSAERERATPSYSPVRRSRSPDHDDDEDDDSLRRSSRKRNRKSASKSRSRSRGSYRRSRRSRSRSRRSRTRSRSRSRSRNKRFTRSRSTRSRSKSRERTSKSKSPHISSPSKSKTNEDTENDHDIVNENIEENGKLSEKDD